jgi:transposase
MLTMTQINLIRHLVFKKGMTFTEVTEFTGHDFRTVKKYIEKADWNCPLHEKDNRGRPSKTATVEKIIDQWLVEDLKYPPKQRHTAKRIFQRLNEDYPGLYTGSDRTIRSYVSKRRKRLFNQSEGYLPLTHPPGEAQADFGEALFYEKGQEIKGYYLTLSFPYSNASYVQVFKGQNQECLLTGLQSIFERIGYVPTRIWFDNLSAAVASIKAKGERQLTQQFERFSFHYGFEHNFCNPNSGHEKGNGKRKIM